MKDTLEFGPVATALVVIFALVGAALVILSATGDVAQELRLTFNQYLEAMAIAVAGLAVGRGLKARRA